MKMLLSVPLRTSLELPVRYSAHRPVELVEALTGIVEELSKYLGPDYLIKSISDTDDRPVKLYKRLNEDFIPITFQPLVTLDFINLIKSDLITMPGCSRAAIYNAELHIYDRTMGILELVFDFDSVLNLIDFENEIDYWTDSYAKKTVERLHNFSIAIFNHLTAARANHKNGVMCPVDIKSSFFDMYRPICRSLSPAPLWTSRVIFTDSDNTDMGYWDSWTQGQTSERSVVKLGKQSGVLCVGNSVVFGKIDLAIVNTLQRGLRLSNLTYATVHVISKNLRSVHGDFIGGKIRPSVTSEITSSIRNTLDIVERDCEDGLLGVQGSRSAVVTSYLKAWSFEALLNTSHKRINSIFALIQESLVRRNIRYSRIVESALSVIGGITLLDFSLNLMTFSRSEFSKEDGVYGLVDFAKGMPEDKLLYGLLLIIAIIGFSKYLKK